MDLLAFHNPHEKKVHQGTDEETNSTDDERDIETRSEISNSSH